MRTTLMALALLLCPLAFGQKPDFQIYKGKMDNKMPVTLFLKAEDNGCSTELLYQGMYKYDGVSGWLQLFISQNDAGRFILVEHGFTGVMILERIPGGFSGLWISPDTKKQLKVELHKETLTEKERKVLEDKLEQVNYENNDC